jgi:hypothetical protein
MKLRNEIRDLFRTLNESPAACAAGALLGIGGAVVLVCAVLWIAGVCHFGL